MYHGSRSLRAPAIECVRDIVRLVDGRARDIEGERERGGLASLPYVTKFHDGSMASINGRQVIPRFS